MLRVFVKKYIPQCIIKSSPSKAISQEGKKKVTYKNNFNQKWYDTALWVPLINYNWNLKWADGLYQVICEDCNRLAFSLNFDGVEVFCHTEMESKPATENEKKSICLF